MDDERAPSALSRVLADIARERENQDRVWGMQEFPDGTGPEYARRADEAKAECAAAHARGELTWRHILTEEFLEALAESDLVRLREELIQTAAVAVQWVQSIDRRNGALTTHTKSPTPSTARADNTEPSKRTEATANANPTGHLEQSEPNRTSDPSERDEPPTPTEHRDHARPSEPMEPANPPQGTPPTGDLEPADSAGEGQHANPGNLAESAWSTRGAGSARHTGVTEYGEPTGHAGPTRRTKQPKPAATGAAPPESTEVAGEDEASRQTEEPPRDRISEIIRDFGGNAVTPPTEHDKPSAYAGPTGHIEPSAEPGSDATPPENIEVAGRTEMSRQAGRTEQTGPAEPGRGAMPREGTEASGREPAPGAGEKLVRDRIPEIIRVSGGNPVTRVAEHGEYAALLRAKLYEEAGEYMASGDPAELADVLEVIGALAALHDLSPAALERLRAEKAAERGGFAHRHVLCLDTTPT
jgi:predicted house-cleaning noncanonical NTP pyrophosphatase (MazG superfamily)